MPTNEDTPAPLPQTPMPAGRKTHIVNVARRLWGQHGYRGMPLRRIADDAGVALALIDHHFGAKHDLFARAVEPIAAACAHAQSLLPAADAPASADAGRAALRALVEPAWLLVRDELGRDALRLWLMHRHDPLPEVQLPLTRATEPLLTRATQHLYAIWPSAPQAMLRPGSTILFGMAAELCLHEQPIDDNPHPPPAGRPALTADRIVTVLAAGLELARLRTQQQIPA